MDDALPEPWESALTERGFVHGGRASVRALAKAANIGSAETVRQMIHGMRDPDTATVEAVALALGVDVLEVSRWVGHARTVRKPYVVPADIALLTEEEQAAVTNLITAIARTRRARDAAADSPARRLTAVPHQEEAPAAPKAARKRNPRNATRPDPLA